LAVQRLLTILFGLTAFAILGDGASIAPMAICISQMSARTLLKRWTMNHRVLLVAAIMDGAAPKERVAQV
jgi:hypothetical protein